MVEHDEDPSPTPPGTRMLKAVTKTDAMHHGNASADLESGDIFTRKKQNKKQTNTSDV